jgi:GNAT superfamily N-acetyltransferase
VGRLARGGARGETGADLRSPTRSGADPEGPGSAADREASATDRQAAAVSAGAARTDGAAPARRGRRALPGGFELDDDPARLDVTEIHRYLSEESYWAAGRTRATVERLIREATGVVGLYQGARQIGFARTVSDDQSFAYLADVYVLPGFRGLGLGVELVREAVDNSPYARRRWLLHTLDAHGLYRKVGFGAPGERLMERPPS